VTPISLSNNTIQTPYVSAPPATPKPAAATDADTTDSLQLSPAAVREAELTGRIALNEQYGKLSSDQAKQLYSQVSYIHSQIVSDEQNDGGTLSSSDAQTIAQMQNAVRQTLYREANPGATPPSTAGSSGAVSQEAVQAGRIVFNEAPGEAGGA
jgi:hypothetical protein